VSVLDLLSVRGGLRARVEAVAEHAAALRAGPPIVVCHDAGLLVGLALAEQLSLRALVLLGPVVPGTDRTHALLWSWGLPWKLVAGRAIGPPSGATADAMFDALPHASRRDLGSDDARIVARLLRRMPFETTRRHLDGTPVLALRGVRDAVTAPDDVTQMAAALGGEGQVLSDAGHWLLAGAAWQRCATFVHRWIVRALGEPLLEYYAEAMADRDQDQDSET
jgi:hypothetical protein